MKKVIKIILLFCFMQMHSQSSKLHGSILYEQIIMNNDNRIIKDYTLVFNRLESYYVEIVPAGLEKGQKNEDDGTIVLNTRDNKKPQFYYNKLNSEIYFSEIYYNTHLFVKDSVNLTWQIEQETKLIGEYECQKAITKFRGRTYTAWFTSVINVPFGPWKLSGLNGLILEVYDETGFLTIHAKKIMIETSKDKTNSIPRVDTSNALSVKAFLKNKTELQYDFVAKLNSKLPKGVKPFKIDLDCKDCGKELEQYENSN